MKLLSSKNRYSDGSAKTLFEEQTFNILFYNVQGLLSHVAELTATIRVLTSMPALICLNETFLNDSIENVYLEGYDVVARRDRNDGRKGGGVMVYALSSLSNRVTLVEESKTHERVWMVLHADTGPYLIGVWYRPPDPGEVVSVEACEQEWQRLSLQNLGTILIGDLSLHHV